MILLAITTGVVGYTLVYGGIKGGKATIDGTPIWRAPWLPFVKALSGSGPDSVRAVVTDTKQTVQNIANKVKSA